MHGRSGWFLGNGGRFLHALRLGCLPNRSFVPAVQLPTAQRTGRLACGNDPARPLHAHRASPPVPGDL